METVMPWKDMSKKTMREEFVKRVLMHEKSKSALCREYGISRPTGDKWIARYLSGEELSDLSKAPKTVGNKTNPEIERFIVDYRKKYPAIGATKLHRMILNEGEFPSEKLPCPRTINNIIKRNDLISKEASDASTPYKRFEKSYPNEMWQADFKGFFTMGNGKQCHPLNIIDDHSRFNLCCHPLLGETYHEVKPILTGVFQEYGLPFSFLCDNGNPWGTSQSTGFTAFEVWLMDLGILTLHGRIVHPQTQGKEEKFNGSMKRELLRYTKIMDELDAAKKFSEYRDFYNHIRPHHSLKLDVPADRYVCSERSFPDQIKEWEYSEDKKLRKVKSTGYVTIGNQGYYLSESFGGKTIAIRESVKKPSCINLYYRQFIIGQIDVDKRVFTFKKAYLIDNDPRKTL